MSGPEPTRPSVKALLQGLRELGYVYGRDFVTEPRGGEGRPELWPGLAAEIVRLQVDVIVAAGPIMATLKQATTTIPIVMAGASDPIGDGYIQSLSRPGGNVTGLSLQEIDTIGEATRAAQGARSLAGAGGGPLEQLAPGEHSLLAGRRDGGPEAGMEAPEARDSRGQRGRGAPSRRRPTRAQAACS